MAELEYKKMEVFKVDYSEIENLVEKVYGHSFNFHADEEMGSDSYRLYNVNGEVNESAEKALKEFKETGYNQFITRTLLNDMCRQGVIEKGNYLVDTDY